MPVWRNSRKCVFLRCTFFQLKPFLVFIYTSCERASHIFKSLYAVRREFFSRSGKHMSRVTGVRKVEFLDKTTAEQGGKFDKNNELKCISRVSPGYILGRSLDFFVLSERVSVVNTEPNSSKNSSCFETILCGIQCEWNRLTWEMNKSGTFTKIILHMHGVQVDFFCFTRA